MNKTMVSLLVAVLIVFCISIFKHISHPLLWNDEAETVSFGQSILHHGYPKIHDGKNIIYPLDYLDLRLGEDTKTDAFIGSGWGCYYFATAGIILASAADDIYIRTALLRIPFAIIGICGIVLLALTVITIFERQKDKLLALLVFFIFEVLSISLVLHLREVRYYSIVLLLCAALLFLYVRRHVFDNIRPGIFFAAAIALLFILFNTFIPAYAAFVLFWILDWCRITIQRAVEKPTSLRSILRSIQSESKKLLPLIVSLLSVLPVAFFFRTAEISRAISEQFGFNGTMFVGHIASIAAFLGKYEYLYLALSVKLLAFLSRFFSGRGEPDREVLIATRLSGLIGLFVILAVLLVARLPFYIYERYFIFLQPFIIAMLVLDSAVAFKRISRCSPTAYRTAYRILTATILLPFVFCTTNKIESLTGHLYEITHPYYGPVDYAISFLKKNISTPERLVIATNYEENTYMYYLDCKVIFGYTGKNLAEDSTIQPDIIIYRKGWGNFAPEFQSLLERARYHKWTLPIEDLLVNNIPELRHNNDLYHRFKTEWTNDERRQLQILVKGEDTRPGGGKTWREPSN
jgi:hypothetical protein